MIKAVLIGYGNVGVHIAKAFEQHKDIDLIEIYSRNLKSLENCPPNIPTTTILSDLKKADVYLLAVPDKTVAQVSQQLPFDNRLVVHTSGSVSLQAMEAKNHRGVWYPLQTFSKGKTVSFSNVPICVEAEREEDYKVLEKLGALVSNTVHKISSEQRASLHLAAVFANNFSNHMYHIAQQIVEDKKVDFSLLRPLIEETAQKINTLLPSEAQTGPAVRNDTSTIEKHLEALNHPDHKKLYTFITQSIKHNSSQ